MNIFFCGLYFKTHQKHFSSCNITINEQTNTIPIILNNQYEKNTITLWGERELVI